jgi:hypothetical protein
VLLIKRFMKSLVLPLTRLLRQRKTVYSVQPLAKESWNEKVFFSDFLRNFKTGCCNPVFFFDNIEEVRIQND